MYPIVMYCKQKHLSHKQANLNLIRLKHTRQKLLNNMKGFSILTIQPLQVAHGWSSFNTLHSSRSAVGYRPRNTANKTFFLEKNKQVVNIITGIRSLVQRSLIYQYSFCFEFIFFQCIRLWMLFFRLATQES